MSTFNAALEVGTTRTVLAIGRADSAGRVKVICHAEIPSTGVRKSQILDIKDATQAIRAVLNEIDKRQGEVGLHATIGNAYLVMNGQHVSAASAQGMKQVDGKISEEDMNAVYDHARSMPIPETRELLDIAEQDYEVDSSGGIINPKGKSGHILKLNTLQIVADKSRVQDARTAADAANLDICDPLFAVTCAAEAVLEDYEKKNGVLVLDLGGGSTGYAVYTDGYLATTGAIGVGGDHVTNDIAHAFQTTNAQAEDLKTHEACAILSTEAGASARVKIPGANPLLESRTISRRALDTVVNARLRELFDVLREKLEGEDLLNRLHAGVVLTGGGAQMNGIGAIIEQALGSHVRLGRPAHVDGLDDADFPPAYAAIAGALIYAHQSDAARGSIFDGLRRLFK